MLNDYWFEWNGVKSTDFTSDVSSLHVSKAIRFSSPKRKFTKYNVSGRNGDVFVLQDAYENMTISIDVFLYNIPRDPSSYKDLSTLCRNIANWIYGPMGYAKLKLYGKDGYYLACYNGPFDVENSLYQFGKATIDFDCRPENYITSTPTIYTEIPTEELYDNEYVKELTIRSPSDISQNAKPIIAYNLTSFWSDNNDDFRIKIYEFDGDLCFTTELPKSLRAASPDITHLVMDTEATALYLAKRTPLNPAYDDDLGFNQKSSINVSRRTVISENSEFPTLKGNEAYNYLCVRIEKRSGNFWGWAGENMQVNEIIMLPRWWKL